MLARARLVLFLSAAVSTLGCTWGPRALTKSRTKYNQAVQVTANEQLLLNLVRLRYRDAPEFLTVEGITTQYRYDTTARLDADLIASGRDILGLTGELERRERPTISYSPPQDQLFHSRLMTPIDIDTLVQFCRSGWDWNRVLRLVCQNINGVDNATFAGGPTPESKPEFEEFLYLCELLQTLRNQRAIEMAYDVKTEELSTEVAADTLKAEDLVTAAEQGLSFRKQGSQTVILTEERTQPVLRVAPQEEVLHSLEMWEIARSLDLQPSRTSYDLVSAVQGQLGPDSRMQASELTEEATRSKRMQLNIETRSILEIMYFLSHTVQVPREHEASGLVTVTADLAGQPFNWQRLNGDLLQIYVASHRPPSAVISVRYRDYWFYIDDRDLESKATFSLLLQLYNLEIRSGGATRVPILALGVGGED